VATLAIAAFVYFVRWRKPKAKYVNLVVSGLYALPQPDKTYHVAKLLAFDHDTVHLRIYKNVFQSIPTHIDPATLTFGFHISEMDENNKKAIGMSSGIGHAPIALEGFAASNPTQIGKTTVTEEELSGYNFWKNGGAE